MRFQIIYALPFAVLLAAALAGCDSGPKEVKASCDMRAGAGSGSSICIDFYTKPNDKVVAICTEGSGVLAEKACDHTKALGGCEKGNLADWYYPSSRHTTADAVKKECSGTFLPATAAR